MAWKSQNGCAVHDPVSILLLLEMPQWPRNDLLQAVNFCSFNPSFTGNAAMAQKTHIMTIENFQFQSFFYWKCRNGQQWDCKPGIPNLVSILLLLEMPQWQPDVADAMPPMDKFQSFFYWKCRNGIA